MMDSETVWNMYSSISKIKKLVHLVGFIIRIYHDAWSSECQRGNYVGNVITRNFRVIRCGGIVTKLYSISTMKNQNTTKQPDFYHDWKFLNYIPRRDKWQKCAFVDKITFHGICHSLLLNLKSHTTLAPGTNSCSIYCHLIWCKLSKHALITHCDSQYSYCFLWGSQ